MIMAPHRRELTVKEKLEVIEFSKANMCGIRKVANQFKISKTYVATILKSEKQIMECWIKNGNDERKRNFSCSQGKLLDTVVFEWYSRLRSCNISVSGRLIQEKAKEAAKECSIENFQASNGWLEKFRARHKISFKAICEESTATDDNAVQSWNQKIAEIVANYSPEDVWNLDEIGLFYRALPEKIMCLKGESCSGGKEAKERLTVMLSVNMGGGKEKPLVIGKSAKSRCFHGLNVDNLPVVWKFNKKAWMTREIMTEWLMELDLKMKREHRKILLFMDNAASHPHLQLDNVKLVFFPPNCTSMCQPFEQGIIKNFKVMYRQFVLKHLISSMELSQHTKDLTKSVNVLNAVTWISKAWQNVTNSTVQNCFKKAGFNVHDIIEEYVEENLDLTSLRKLLITAGTSSSAIDYAGIDENLNTEDVSCNIKEIIHSNVTQSNAEEEPNSDSEEEIEDTHKLIPNYGEALRLAQLLKAFSISKGDSTALMLLSELEMHFEENISSVFNKQTKNTESF